MSYPLIFLTLLGVLLALLGAGVWVAMALMGMALVALAFFECTTAVGFSDDLVGP